MVLQEAKKEYIMASFTKSKAEMNYKQNKMSWLDGYNTLKNMRFFFTSQ